jgi:hypothetical protein
VGSGVFTKQVSHMIVLAPYPLFQNKK